jgi:c-di-GMP-binding flagellar brake protein YcgR
LTRKESRLYPRVFTVFSVEYTLGDRTVQARATSLGGGGLFLQSQSLAEGTEITLRFRPARHLPVMEVRGRIRYMLPGKGSGVEFVEIRHEDHQMILRLIHSKTANRRKHPRVPLATQIYCQECMSLAFSRDVSRGGMFVDTRDPLPIGSEITLRFHLNDGGPIVVALAEVKYHVTKLGMGIQFLELSPADRKRIDDYVAKTPKLPEPSPEE